MVLTCCDPLSVLHGLGVPSLASFWGSSRTGFETSEPSCFFMVLRFVDLNQLEMDDYLKTWIDLATSPGKDHEPGPCMQYDIFIYI